MKTLAIDTSNQTMALAVVENQQALGQIQTMVNKNHSISLMPAIEMLMKSVQLKPADLNQIVVAQGPGSYTGLRIGVTTAKTLAATLSIPLVGVSSLKTLAANCTAVTKIILPIFDARRQNVYAGAYRWQDGQLVTIFEDQHISLKKLIEQFPAKDLYFVGQDTEKFRSQIEELAPEAEINTISQWNYPNGIVLGQLGAETEPTNEVHEFLPHYLKLVEAEEKWLASHQPGAENYVEKI